MPGPYIEFPIKRNGGGLIEMEEKDLQKLLALIPDKKITFMSTVRLGPRKPTGRRPKKKEGVSK